MERSHDKEFFYKYMTVDTALKVISSKCLRWSSPLKFNDPFDHQIGFTFKFGGPEIAQAIYEESLRIIFEGKTNFIAPTLFTQLALNLHAKINRIPREVIMKGLQEASQEIADNFEYHTEKLHDAIRGHLTHARILCVSEVNDNVVMWSHYADAHQGVVLKLNCVEELDNTLLAARKVNYSRAFPMFPTVDEYVRHLTGENPLDLVPLTWEIAYTKHSDWEYEKEWRVHMPLKENEPPGDGYTLLEEHPRVFGAVYLGCRMSGEARDQILKAVEQHIPHVQVFQAKKCTSSFDLEFEKV